VLPYKDVLTSGAVLLAMSFGRACIAPRLGTITDYLDDRGAFLYDANDPAGLSKALQEALEKSEQTETMGKHNLQKAEECSWNRIAQATVRLYQRDASEGCIENAQLR
ncbi:MAG TPA: glycosyltransferase family 1 protein, partial [Verrucomicrobiota bacterium]|nr:glycosyltransferase family 1 protein [Verrucomicrobiota bacterium]